MAFLANILGGVWGYVAAAVFAAALAVGATHFIDANAYGKQIADLKTQAAQQQTVNATAAIKQLTGFIADLTKAEHYYQDALADISAKYAAISTEFKHAITAKPLPADCRIDAARLRILSAATAAANAAHSAAAH